MEVDMSPLQEPEEISYQNLCSRKTRLLVEVASIDQDLEGIKKDIEHHKFWLENCISKQKDLIYFKYKTKKELQEMQTAIINLGKENPKKDSES
jgi:hypothetical protein